tara:strand:- start:70 stop:645 length:576 start_codon:yes stop_codon:yes gene_type:complete
MINKNIDFYIKNYNGVIDETICNQTIKELSLQNNEFKQHQFYDEINKVHKTLSGNQELDTINYIPTTYKIFMDTIFESLKKYMKHIDLPYFNGWSGYSQIRWNRYKEDRKMAEHCDHIQSLFDGDRKGVPTLSCLGCLNDDYEGGDLVFFGDKIVEFKRGDLLIFPSNFLYPHRVEPVKSGVRWSYISWVW